MPWPSSVMRCPGGAKVTPMIRTMLGCRNLGQADKRDTNVKKMGFGGNKVCRREVAPPQSLTRFVCSVIK